MGSQIINTYVPINNYPFEQAIKKVAGSEAMQQYLALFQQYLPNGKAQTLLGVDAFAAWLLFAQGANVCGNNLTRKCMYTAMQKVTSFHAVHHGTGDPRASMYFATAWCRRRPRASCSRTSSRPPACSTATRATCSR